MLFDWSYSPNRPGLHGHQEDGQVRGFELLQDAESLIMADTAVYS